MDLLVTVESFAVSPSPTARNLSVVLVNQLCCSANISAVTPSCTSALYNIRRIRPSPRKEGAQNLVQVVAISRLHYCSSLLAGLPACPPRAVSWVDLPLPSMVGVATALPSGMALGSG